MAIPIDDFVAATQRAKASLSSFDLAVKEFQETGNWMGEKYGATFSSTAQPKNLMAEDISALEPKFRERFTEEGIAGRRQQLETDVTSAGFREERKRMRIAQNVTDVEDFTQEEWDRLVSKTNEMYKVADVDMGNYKDLFKKYNVNISGTDDNLQYLIHSGAPELHGGKLDPSFTKGSVNSSEVASNTKGINSYAVKDKLMSSDAAKEKNSFILKMIDEEEANFMSATTPDARSA